ncbi:MAG: HEAT repeat domain-containing protein [Planctomycetota bacterium]
MGRATLPATCVVSARGPPFELGPTPAALPERDPSGLVHRGFAWPPPADAKGLFAYRLAAGEAAGRIERRRGGRILGAGRGCGLEGKALLRVTRAEATPLGQPRACSPGGRSGPGWPSCRPRGGDLGSTGERDRAELAPWGELGAEPRRGRRLIAAGRGAYALGTRSPESAPTPCAATWRTSLGAYGRRAAAVLLAAGEAARETVAALAEDADPEVALRASEVLGELDRAVRVARWRPLIQDAWARQVPDLLNRLTHPNPHVRLEALRHLGAIQGDPEVAALLRELIGDLDAHVARTAAIALLTRGDRAGIEVLDQALEADEAPGRIEVLDALAAHGAPEDVGRVLPALDDPRPAVRAAAAVAALSLDREGAVAGLAERFAEEPAEVQLAILRGLGDLGAVQGPALSILIAASEQQNDELRLVATTALANPALGGRRPCAALGRVARRLGARGPARGGPAPAPGREPGRRARDPRPRARGGGQAQGRPGAAARLGYRGAVRPPRRAPDRRDPVHAHGRSAGPGAGDRELASAPRPGPRA